ncbi:MAG: hypothetical protein IJ086_11510 [Clostridium sp.]|nr:hypothetical protein [Clostridium sp.]
MNKIKNLKRINKNIEEIKKYSDKFIFEPRILTIDDYIKYIDKEIKITHKKCGHSNTMTLSDWIKKSPQRSNRLNFFKTDDIDSICYKCGTAKLQERVDEIYYGDIKLISDFINTKTKIEVQHCCSNKSFLATYDSLMSGNLICKICNTKLNNIGKRNEWLNKKLRDENVLDILPTDDYIGYNVEMNFLHTICNRTFPSTLNNLLRRKNKCPHCNEDAIQNQLEKNKNIIVNDVKIKKTNDDYLTVTAECLTCNKEFIDYKVKVKNKKILCPHCNTTKNNFISLKEKLDSYNKKFKGRFEILEPFITTTEKIKIKRLSCGHTFKNNINNISRKNYHDTCQECKRLERLSYFKEKLNTKYEGRYIVLNSEDKFKNNTSSLLFLDRNCNKVFISSFNNIINRDFKCPNCEIKNLNDTIKADIFNKFKGEYLMLSEYVNSKTPIKFKHKTCNHIFHKTKHQFFNSKIPCKECSKKARSLGIENAQERINNKFGKLFSLKGIYKNNETKLPVMCNNCNCIEEFSLNNLLSKKQCNNCNTSFL